MSVFGILAALGLVAVLLGLAHILISRPITGSALLAAVLSAAFAAYTIVTIGRDGLVMFWTNHTANLTGIQVWWDLLISVTLAFFFIAPRAHKAGMNVPLWGLFTLATASIGLLAMAARLFALEKAQAKTA